MFLGPIGKQKRPPWTLIGWNILDFFLHPLYRIQGNLTGIKISTPSTEFVYLGLIGKPKSRPDLGLTETLWTSSLHPLYRFSTKFDRKQNLNVLCQLLISFFGRSENRDGHPGIWLAETFFTDQNSTKLDRSQDLNILFKVCPDRTNL